MMEIPGLEIRGHRFQIKSKPNEDWLHVVGGPTGYESMQIRVDSVRSTIVKGWSACAGGGGWKALRFSPQEMRKVWSRVFDIPVDELKP